MWGFVVDGAEASKFLPEKVSEADEYVPPPTNPCPAPVPRGGPGCSYKIQGKTKKTAGQPGDITVDYDLTGQGDSIENTGMCITFPCPNGEGQVLQFVRRTWIGDGGTELTTKEYDFDGRTYRHGMWHVDYQKGFGTKPPLADGNQNACGDKKKGTFRFCDSPSMSGTSGPSSTGTATFEAVTYLYCGGKLIGRVSWKLSKWGAGPGGVITWDTPVIDRVDKLDEQAEEILKREGWRRLIGCFNRSATPAPTPTPTPTPAPTPAPKAPR